MKALAYFDEWSRRPGQKVRMAISSELPELHAIFVQLLSGPGDPKNPTLKSKEFPEILETVVSTRLQSTRVGSYADLPLSSPVQAPLTVHLHFWPTFAESSKKQVILAVGEGQQSLNLEFSGGKVRLSGEGGHLEASLDVQPQTWYSVAFTVGPDGIGFLDVARRTGLSSSSERVGVSGAVGSVAGSLLRVASAGLDAAGSPLQPFNGKVEGVTAWNIVLDGASIDGLHADRIPSVVALGCWDFSKEMHSQSVIDITSRNPDGCVIGGAERAVTSHAWSGLSDDYHVVPNEYAAIQFHEDEMLDSNWEFDLEFNLPEDIPSGLYGVRLTAPGFEDCYPLFVASRPDQEADVLFLFSTNTYMAYANDRLASMGDILSKVMPHELVIPEDEKYLHEHDELGRSCYDTHSDGTPIRFSSRRRPILNVRPGYPNFLSGYRHFPADMYLLEWVARSGLTFHIATDDDVETDGIDLFRRYKTIVTSCHPEYWTLKGLNSLQDYLTHGGRIMYLGGNGFYWVTSIDPERPWIMEVRRDNSGTRCWNAPPGERTHLYGGVPGGLWRWRGRGPNRMLGVGFASEGWNVAQPFVRQPASYSGKGKEWFEGISAAVIGDNGYLLGGVAGDEVDRYDLALGSPADAEVLCTATGFANEYQLVIEDQLLGLPNQGGVDRQDVVRCDMVYFSIEGGGAVFSGSSIAYCGALAWNNFENDLEIVTTRVLLSFCSSLPGD